jgi:predicted 3-demethylubiquinone-9 3-methyltransferase (glyoxalase superfamily)
MTVAFELDGQRFTALNGGPVFQFSEAISFEVSCASQTEVDHYWEALSDGGSEQQCGWLKDRFGVSWQIVPAEFLEMVADADPERVRRVSEAMFTMRKLDLNILREAYGRS